MNKVKMSIKAIVSAACLKATLTITFLLAFSHLAQAGTTDFVQWQSTNVQLLQGHGFELAPSKKITTATLEHAHGNQLGDVYFFLDYLWPAQGDEDYYGEISPRLSLSKITGKAFSAGLIKDVLIATTIEKPKNLNHRYLYGVGLDWQIPDFKFFKTNFYVRDDRQLDKTIQLTLAWNRPFSFKGYHFLFEGFADIVGDAGKTKKSHQLIVPRFLMDASQAIGMAKNKLFIGVEWQYWHNKFGVDGVTESVPQLQLKYTL